VATALEKRLEQDLNAIRHPGKAPNFLLTQFGIRFEVRYLPRMSTPDERFTTGRLDFPVYILNAHTSDSISAKDIRELMLDHGIIDAGPAHKLYEEADEGWKDTNVEGLGIPPLSGD
jgi:hypothetical protein